METNKLLLYNERRANKSNIWLLFLFLGWSYGSMDQIFLQIIYYLTLGGLGVWTLYRLFTLNKAIRNYNKKIAKDIGMNESDISSLGL
ncbi:MAG: hypothetical protein L7U70_04380 [Flavobacteriales bacterium]|nr:hypothetical protein [Flavobacteriales bacterium]